MDIFIIVIITIIVLFLLFLALNLSHSNKLNTKVEVKQEEKKTEPVKEKDVSPATEKKQTTQLTTRPDFSDMLPEKKASTDTRKISEYEEINGGRLKVLKASSGIEKETNLARKATKNNKLAKELKELSPEMKTVVFGKVLDNID